jgi:cytoskeleton protein RodZ
MAVRPASSFGAQLRKAREAKGLSLAPIAAVTKISVRALEAVERSEYSRLPGGIFMRSFVRAYAGEVGLDPDAALKSFLAECPDDVASVPTGSPESIDGPTTERWYHRIPWTRLAVLALLAAAIAGSAAYLYGRHSAPDQVHQTPTVPSEPPAQAPAAVAQPSPAPTTPAVRAPKPPSAAAMADAPPVGPEPPPIVTSPTLPGASLTLGLTASAPCWVEVTVDGRPPDARLFTQGEHLLVRVDKVAVVKVGDAASMQVTLNGRPGRSLGRAGQVMTIRVTPDNYQDFLPSESAH